MGKIKDLIKADSLTYKQQEAGFSPVFRVLSQNSYKDTELGTNWVVDTIPTDIKASIEFGIRDDYADVSTGALSESILHTTTQAIGSVTGGIKDKLKTLKTEILSSLSGTIPPEDRPLQGCVVDTSFRNSGVYSWANVIFQNPIGTNPQGDEFFGTDFLKVGFPVWIYSGYVTVTGDIVGHPFATEKMKDIPLIFAGLVGALRQEINLAGDRMVLQCVGYRWLLDQFNLGSGGTESASEGRLIIPSDLTLEQAINWLFRAWSKDGGSEIPDIVAKAMRIEKQVECRPAIRYMFGASADKRMVITSGDNEELGRVRGDNAPSYSRMLARIEKHYKVDIFWDVNGYLVARGHDNPFQRIRDDFDADIPMSAHNVRIHDAVLGGNVRDWQFETSVEGTSSTVMLTINRTDSAEASDTLYFDRAKIDEVVRLWQTDSYDSTPIDPMEEVGIDSRHDVDLGIGGSLEKYFDDEDDFYKMFGKKTKLIRATMSTSEEVATMVDDGFGITHALDNVPREFIEQIARRSKYWGMRGTAMIMGDSNVREGDLIRITDIRSKGEGALTINVDAAQTVLKSLKSSVEEAVGEDSPSLAIRAFHNIYYIWKIRQYVGADGFWTKIYFIKQRDAWRTLSPTMRAMRKQAGATADDDIGDVSALEE